MADTADTADTRGDEAKTYQTRLVVASSRALVAARPTRKERWRRLRRRAMWTTRVALAVLTLLAAFLSLTPAGRAASRAALLFEPVVAASQPPALRVVGEPIRHTTETFATAYDTVYLDIYAPTSPTPVIPHAREGVIIIAGVGDNRQAPQLINLSEALARSGIVVMDMTTDILFNFTVSPLDTEAAVQTYLRLARWPGVDARRIGFLGLSAGGALSCFAAVDPRIRDSVAFLVLFGSYYNATDMLRDFGRRALLVNGHYQPWQPISNPFDVPAYVLAQAIAATLPSDQGNILLNAFGPNASAPSASDLAALTPSALAAYHLLAGDQSNRVDANIAALSPAMHAQLLALSPSTVAPQIRAHIYLLHDSSDQYVPFTESRDFDAALTRLGRPHDFVEFSIFSHVEVRSGLGLGPLLGDGARLYRILYEILLPAS